jgi:hypothetical protein
MITACLINHYRSSPIRICIVLVGLFFIADCGGSTPTAPSLPTSVLTYSRPAHPLVGPESGNYTRDNATFEADLRTDQFGVFLWVKVIPPTGSLCQLFIAPPRGQPLTVGSYPATMRWPAVGNPQVPGLDFSCGNGCNTSDGNFVIRELTPTNVGPVQRLDVTFEQTCHRFGLQGDERMATLTGQLRIVPGR